jgi:hypothetical protein
MRKIITEINRIREMIGVSLIVEGIGDVLNIFTNLGKKSIKELSNEEQEIISKLIKDSAEIQRAGIRSIDDVMSDAGKQLLLKTIRENSVAVKNVFSDIITKYANNSMVIINKNLELIPDLKTELSKLKAGPNTALDIIRKIESNGIQNIDTLQLAALKKTLTDAKTTFVGNSKMITYLDDVTEQVDGYIKSNSIKIDDIITQDTPQMGGGKIKNPQRTIYEQKPDGSVGEIEMPSWVWDNWWKDGDIRGGNIILELKNKVSRIDNKTFNPNDIKVLNFTTDSGGREYYELLLPTNDKVILYKSSGTGSPELKQKGDWQIVNGFTSHPNDNNFFWVAKDVNSTQYTKGESRYFTDLSDYLKQNGDNPITLLGNKSVFSNIKPKTELNFLSNKFGDTSEINWSVITNAKNIVDYDKLINDAFTTGDFSKISRSGFENYDIPNFREYLMDMYYKNVNPDYGTPINLKQNESPSNWYDYQQPGFSRSPYEKYGAGSN